MIARHLTSTLEQVATQSPVVTLTGPRQSGKTTLVKATFPEFAYVTLEEPDTRAFALEDPRGFLAQFAGPVVLDEIQRAPDLFSYIQPLVDERAEPGQFILTGSQNFLLLRSISQSLAGRAAILHLLPLSQRELLGRRRLNLASIGRNPLRPSDNERAKLMSTMFRGFYPRIHDQNLDPKRWLADYDRTYVERDVREIVNVGDLASFGRFLRLCAGRVGQLLNLSSLASDCGITHTTARRWLSILEASFIVTQLRPHHRNFNKRLIKSPKLYFLDTGLLCYLLGIDSPEHLLLHASRGAIFENFVLAELLKNGWNEGMEPRLAFWRDSHGREVDFILEHEGTLVAMEAKSGATITRDSFRGLEFWRTLTGDDRAPATLIYGGEESYRRRGFVVNSWASL